MDEPYVAATCTQGTTRRRLTVVVLVPLLAVDIACPRLFVEENESTAAAANNKDFSTLTKTHTHDHILFELNPAIFGFLWVGRVGNSDDGGSSSQIL